MPRKRPTRRSSTLSAARGTGPAARGVGIEVVWRPRRAWGAGPLLRRVAHYAVTAEGFRSGQLTIVVVGSRTMAALHRRFAGAGGTTDVLTFDYGAEAGPGRLDAEVYVCADVAQQRAARRGGTLAAARAELALYVVHGILHLAGYDDHTARDFERMHAREDQLLERLGLGPVFGLLR
ncbi:MAG: rRNA maturation RNase YbeY [Phycisphaerae bacterium]|nr:rRNA maturation RNase YbeY [Phycisphaerae bacterium]